MTVSEILRSGQPLQVDLLTEFPLDTNPSTWVKAYWPGYETAYGFPDISKSTDNAIGGTIDCQFFVDPIRVGFVVAVGVTFQGQWLFTGKVVPDLSKLVGNSPFRIEFVVQPWEGS